MLTIDGLGLGWRSKSGNIIIYRTFVSFDMMFASQYEKVWPVYLYFVCKLAMESSPKDKVILNNVYEDGVKEMHQIAEDANLDENEKRNLIFKEYEQTYNKLVRYIA